MLAAAICDQLERSTSGALLRNAEWLDRMEEGQSYMLLLHRFGQATDGIYLGPQLRKRLSLGEHKALFAPEDLVGAICPLELMRITAYYQHFMHPKADVLQQVVKVCPKEGRSEWLVTYSLRMATGSPYVLTLFRALNDLLANETPSSDLQLAQRSAGDELSLREREVLVLIAQGMSSAEVAKQLNISPLTVKTHRQTMMSKLGTKKVAGLVRFAIKMGL